MHSGSPNFTFFTAGFLAARLFVLSQTVPIFERDLTPDTLKMCRRQMVEQFVGLLELFRAIFTNGGRDTFTSELVFFHHSSLVGQHLATFVTFYAIHSFVASY